MECLVSRLCLGGLCRPRTGDPVDAMVERLMTGEASVGDPERWPWPGCGHPDRPVEGLRCVLATGDTSDTSAHRIGMLTALAARYLLSPGLVTASILGYGGTTYAPLLLIARHVPQVSHVSVYAGAERTGPPDPRVIDELELAGIALSAAGSRDDAVFGASLVVITDPAGVAGPPMHPAKGAVLVNATGRDLPEEVVGRVGHVFVDDLALLSPAARHGPARPARIATHRLPRCQPAGDLRQLVTGEHPGRSSPEQTFLVELLSVNPPTTAADGARTDRPDGT